MPGSADQSAKPVRTWRPMIFWTGALLGLLVLLACVGAVLRARSIAGLMRACRTQQDLSPVLPALGGPEKAARKLDFFLRMPAWLVSKGRVPDVDGWDERSMALRVLSGCGRFGVPALTRELHSPVSAYRLRAALSLGHLGPEAGAAVPELAALLEREVSANGLPPRGDGDAATITPVRREHSEDFGDALLRALGEIGPAAAQAAPLMARLLDSQDIRVRYAACVALARMGPAAKIATPKLRKCMNDSHLKRTAAVALANSGGADDAVVKILMEEAEYRQGRLKIEAISALGEAGQAARAALPLLERIADPASGDPKAAQASAEAVRKIRGKESGK